MIEGSYGLIHVDTKKAQMLLYPDGEQSRIEAHRRGLRRYLHLPREATVIYRRGDIAQEGVLLDPEGKKPITVFQMNSEGKRTGSFESYVFPDSRPFYNLLPIHGGVIENMQELLQVAREQLGWTISEELIQLLKQGTAI